MVGLGAFVMLGGGGGNEPAAAPEASAPGQPSAPPAELKLEAAEKWWRAALFDDVGQLQKSSVEDTIADPQTLLEQLGFDAPALRAQCQAAVERSASWRQSFARSIERCAESSTLAACRAHARRLATSVYFRDADAPCLALWSVDPVTIAPVARPGEPAHDWAAWYRSKLRSGALAERVERLRDFSQS